MKNWLKKIIKWFKKGKIVAEVNADLKDKDVKGTIKYEREL